MGRRRAEETAANHATDGTADNGVPDLAERQRDTAEYLSDMILELRNLARSVKLHKVMVPLEFAYYEAFGEAHRVEVPPAEIERLRSLSRAAEEMDTEATKARG